MCQYVWCWGYCKYEVLICISLREYALMIPSNIYRNIRISLLIASLPSSRVHAKIGRMSWLSSSIKKYIIFPYFNYKLILIKLKNSLLRVSYYLYSHENNYKNNGCRIYTFLGVIYTIFPATISRKPDFILSLVKYRSIKCVV